MADDDDDLPVEARVARVVGLWAVMCCSPVLYLGIAQLIRSVYLGPTGRAGVFAVTPPSLEMWTRAAIILAAALQVVLAGVAWHFRRRMAATAKPADRADLLRRRLFAMSLISETVVLAGFVVFLVGGGLQWVFYLGIVAFADYAASYPPRV